MQFADIDEALRTISNVAVMLLLLGGVSAGAARPQTTGLFIEADRRVDVRLEQLISTRTAQSGDRVTAVLDEGIRSGSQVVLPRGTRLMGRVESVQSGNPDGHGWMRLLFDEVMLPDGRRIRAQFSNLFSTGERHVVIRYVVPLAIGAGAGAVIGGTKARVSGILGGLLAGSVIGFGRYRSVRDVEFQPGRRVSLRLGQDLQIPAVE